MAIAVADPFANQRILRGIGLSVLSFAAFSTADATIKAISGEFSAYQIGLVSSLFALMPILFLTIGRGGLRALVPVKLGLVLVRGVLTATCALLVWTAFAMLPLAEAYAVLFASPMLVTMLSALILREDVGWRRWLATGIGFVGVVIMIDPEFERLQIGHVLVAIAAVCGSFGLIVLRYIGTREKSAPILFTLFLSIVVVAAPMAVVNWVQPSWAELGAMAVAGLLLGSGQAGLVLATRDAPAAVVAPFQYSQMLWAILFGALLFGEVVRTQLLIGLFIVIACGVYIVWRETVRSRPVTFGVARGEVAARVAR